MTRRKMYFIKQKLIGVLGLLLAVLSVHWLNGDVTVAFLVAIPSLLLIFTKRMWIVNDYCTSVMDRRNKRL